MRVRFWGTRGSIAAPGPDTVRYGGNTSCVEVVTQSGNHFVLDCGTGARALGLEMAENAARPIRTTILLTHTHWDHIQGFPFFQPLFEQGSEITVYAPLGVGRSLTDVLAGQMEFTYFPVELDELPAKIDYKDLVEGEYKVNDARVVAQYLNHPTMTLGYRIEADGVIVCYMCDHEPYSTTLWHAESEPGLMDSILHLNDRKHAEFMAGADLVIHDSQYTPEEYERKKGWGHSTYDYVVEMASAAGAKRVILTHHEPTHTDDDLDRIHRTAQELANHRRHGLRVSVAAEGWSIEVAPAIAAVAK